MNSNLVTDDEILDVVNLCLRNNQNVARRDASSAYGDAVKKLGFLNSQSNRDFVYFHYQIHSVVTANTAYGEKHRSLPTQTARIKRSSGPDVAASPSPVTADDQSIKVRAGLHAFSTSMKYNFVASIVVFKY
jgi:hypothetical protein